MIKRIKVYDLDGVLVDTSHRYRNNADGSIDLNYWFANRTSEKIAQDKLLPMSEQYRRDIANPETYVIICTARSDDFSADVKFIRERLGMPDKLLMRPTGNKEGDAKLKRKQLSRLFNLKQFRHVPRFFWDDNIKNLAACVTLFTKVFHVESEITYNG